MGIIITYVIMTVMIVAATTVFEYTKAAVSYALGDRLVKEKGELTLNPIKHFEPIGFLLFLLMGYGWGKPVQTSALYYKNRKNGTILTYGVPIAVNIILGELFYVLSGFVNINNIVDSVFYIGAHCFIKLAVFNIIPIYPLSGSYILKSFLDINDAVKYAQYEKIIQLIVIFALFFGYLNVPLDFISGLFIGW